MDVPGAGGSSQATALHCHADAAAPIWEQPRINTRPGCPRVVQSELSWLSSHIQKRNHHGDTEARLTIERDLVEPALESNTEEIKLFSDHFEMTIRFSSAPPCLSASVVSLLPAPSACCVQ
jgi:hypothetical protein